MIRLASAIVLATVSLTLPAAAAVTAYTDEAAFQAAIAASGHVIAHQDFEDDAVWGALRSTIPGGSHTAPSVNDGHVVWSANNPISGVTTGHGPALVGDWGFYELPHGDPDTGVHDGWVIGSAGAPVFAVGGWFETNTYGARLNFVIDGQTVVDFEGQPLDYAHRFYGVIVDEGFANLEVVETEAVPGDQWYYVFADEFTIALGQETAAPEVLPATGVRLLPNAPNPFNPRTTVAFELDHAASVDLRIFDAAGRLVRTLATGESMPAGRHELAWDGRDGRARPAPAGSYRCVLSTGTERRSRWISLVK